MLGLLLIYLPSVHFSLLLPHTLSLNVYGLMWHTCTRVEAGRQPRVSSSWEPSTAFETGSLIGLERSHHLGLAGWPRDLPVSVTMELVLHVPSCHQAWHVYLCSGDWTWVPLLVNKCVISWTILASLSSSISYGKVYRTFSEGTLIITCKFVHSNERLCKIIAHDSRWICVFPFSLLLL